MFQIYLEEEGNGEKQDHKHESKYRDLNTSCGLSEAAFELATLSSEVI